MARQKNREKKRAGEVLGLGDVIPGEMRGETMTNRETSASSLSDAEIRRRRMNEGADELVPDTTKPAPRRPGPGAAGVDMGAGGEGTDIE